MASIATMYRKAKGIRSISIHGTTYDRLRELGKTPDTFDEIISRLIDEHYEMKQKIAELRGLSQATNQEPSLTTSGRSLRNNSVDNQPPAMKPTEGANTFGI